MTIYSALDDTPLDAITLDPELQPRAKISKTVLHEYAQLLVDGVTFPPVVLFATGEQLLLADGFHRYYVHKLLHYDTIRTEIIPGDRRAALLYSLQANARHGLPRSPKDFARAYETAVRNELVAADDPDAVAALLGCSVRYGYELTLEARAEAKEKRDAAIQAGIEAGKSQREIATELEVPRTTVQDVGRKLQTAKSVQPGDDAPAALNDKARAKLDELASPSARMWSDALRALRTVNEQVAVEVLFTNRFDHFDWVFGAELEAAVKWITELHARFNDEQQPERRRA